MPDAVLDVADAALAAKGFGRLRCNFRGVGSSAGSSTGAAAKPMTRSPCARGSPLGMHRPGCGSPAIRGAAIAWRGHARLHVERLILVAPPTAMPRLEDTALPATTVTVVAGDADPHGALPAFECAGLGLAVRAIAGADHFFAGKWDELAAALTQPTEE